MATPERSLDFVTAHPVLSDVLADSFFPPGDLEQNPHTLGRLMVGAYLKGDNPVPLDADKAARLNSHIRLVAYHYWPAWAPDTVASTYARADNFGPGGIWFVGLSVESADAPGLGIYANRGKFTTIYGNRVVVDEPLSATGRRLGIVRAKVAQWAQQFFETAYVNHGLRALGDFPPDDPA